MIRANRNKITIPNADMEQGTCDEVEGPDEIKKINSPSCIHVHSRRYVLADPDGLCFKWILDSIVSCGILTDDSAKWIKSLTFSQEKISRHEKEETVITIEY